MCTKFFRTVYQEILVLHYFKNSIKSIGRSKGVLLACAPPTGSISFIFAYVFANGSVPPPMGNPGSATEKAPQNDENAYLVMKTQELLGPQGGPCNPANKGSLHSHNSAT